MMTGASWISRSSSTSALAPRAGQHRDPPAIGGDEEERRQQHRDRDRGHEQRGHRRGDDAGQRRGLEDDEAELAALGQEDDEHRPLDARNRHEPRHRPERRCLDEQEADDDAGDRPGLAQDHREIDAHADGDEEEAEQEALERLDVGLELAPVFAFREQHAGEEGAERHRQAHRVHQRRGGDDEQQRRRREDLGRVALGDPAQHRPQQQSAAEDDDGDHADRLGRAEPAAAVVAGGEGEKGQQGEDRNRRHVLQQRDAEDAFARGRGQHVALGENAQADRRRRHRQAEPGDDGDVPVDAEGQRPEPEQQGRAEQLHVAPAEDGLAQRPEALRLELEADQEQHQDDAELGELQHLVGAGDELQAPGADQDAREQVADDRAEAEKARHRHGQHRRAEVDQDAGQPGAVPHQTSSMTFSIGRAVSGTSQSMHSGTSSISGHCGYSARRLT